MQKEEVAIESVEVRIGDVTAKVTIEQARKLRDALDKLFGTPAPVVVSPVVIERVIERDRPFIYTKPFWQIDPLIGSYCAVSNDASCLAIDLGAGEFIAAK